MSDSLTKQEIQSFLSLHPHEDGWKVYQCCTSLARNLYLPYLLDCLRNEHPEALHLRLTAKEPTLEEMLGTSGQSHKTETDSEWDLQKEFDSHGWLGSIEIEWANSLIHCCSLLTDPCLRKEPLFLVATTSNAALRDLFHVLSLYGEKREKRENREILVVNGEDISVSEICWDDVILPPGLGDDIRADVEAFFRSRDNYRELRLPHRRGFLFAGPPGCGKTLTLKALAASIHAKFITVLGRSDVDDSTIERAFYLAEKYTPSVMVFEELDKLLESHHVSLSHFLNLMDGLKVSDGVLVIATSNEPGKLDPALLHRPSRFDRVWKFPMPGYEQRLSLLRRRWKEFFSDAELEEAAGKSEGFSMAYVQEIVINALLCGVRRGTGLDHGMLLQSLETLRMQRKAASKEDESIADKEPVGFSPKER